MHRFYCNKGEKMKAKEYLEQIRDLNNYAANKIAEYNQVREMIYSLSGNGFEERVQTSSENSMENSMIKLLSAEEEAKTAMNNYLEKAADIIEQIENIGNPDYYNILHKKYVQCMSLKQVAAEINYTYGYVRKLHRQALSCFEQKFLKEGTKRNN